MEYCFRHLLLIFTTYFLTSSNGVWPLRVWISLQMRLYSPSENAGRMAQKKRRPLLFCARRPPQYHSTSPTQFSVYILLFFLIIRMSGDHSQAEYAIAQTFGHYCEKESNTYIDCKEANETKHLSNCLDAGAAVIACGSGVYV